MDRFRLNDPDAAEKALVVYLAVLHRPLNSISYQQQQQAQEAMRAVLDAIEQPRLPTRSEVTHALHNHFGRSWLLRVDEGGIEALMVKAGWATEDPEPEVDPAQVENVEEAADDAVRRFAGRLVAVEELHASRHRDVDGFTLRWCRECGQNWPCPTVEACHD